jgi:hypothetical protein
MKTGHDIVLHGIESQAHHAISLAHGPALAKWLLRFVLGVAAVGRYHEAG